MSGNKCHGTLSHESKVVSQQEPKYYNDLNGVLKMLSVLFVKAILLKVKIRAQTRANFWKIQFCNHICHSLQVGEF